MTSIILAMNNSQQPPSRDGRINSILKRLGKAIARLPQLIRDGWRTDLVALRNWWRRQRGARVDFVVFHISGSLPERAGPPRSFLQRQLPLPPRPLTIETLNKRLQRIADAENVRGAVFILGDFTFTAFARLQNLRRSLTRLREAGKEVVVYTPYLDLAHYYVASAAGYLVAPEGAQFDVVGLHSEAIFLRDALAQVGVEAEVLQISPYKTAGNIFANSEITLEQKRQMEWLLDDHYDVITADLAYARDLSKDAIKSFIDAAPFAVERALSAGLVDAVAYEDELPRLLAANNKNVESSDVESAGSEQEASSKHDHAKLQSWDKAGPMLLEKGRRPSRRYIGVVSVDGVIVMGPSRQPPINLPIPLVGGAMSGEETLIQLLRRAENDDNMAALILHVESGGGSSLASELIWRQVTRVAAKKPVLAYMGDVAASGGYFVSAAAGHIMSQRSTITGSIGVLMARMNLHDLYGKLSINRASLNRGAHAGIYSEARPMSPEERNILWTSIQETYKQFKAVVAAGRDMNLEELEQIAGGRVWTGRQALDRHLVDSHGDFIDAVSKAAELAGLPLDDKHFVAARNLFARSDAYIPPQPDDIMQELANLIFSRQLRSLNGQALLIMPFDLRLF